MKDITYANSKAYQKGYNDGLADQKQIDIEKACDLMLITLKELGSPYDFACNIKDKFKKAMEEKI